MNIEITQIQYLHLQGFLWRHGFLKLVGQLPIGNIELTDTGEKKFMYIDAQCKIDEIMEFLQRVKDL